mgnify:FL=1
MKGFVIGIFLGIAMTCFGFLFTLGTKLATMGDDKGDQVQFYTDPGTACEYLISPNGTLVPRIGDDYMQGGCDPQEDY